MVIEEWIEFFELGVVDWIIVMSFVIVCLFVSNFGE